MVVDRWSFPSRFPQGCSWCACRLDCDSGGWVLFRSWRDIHWCRSELAFGAWALRAVRGGGVLIRSVAVVALVVGAVVAVGAAGDSTTSAASTDSFVPLSPSRVLDTRGGVKVGNAAGTAAPYVLQVVGRGGVPASGVGAVALNVTVTRPRVPGFVTVFPCGSRPGASSLNFVDGQTIANAVIAKVSGSGEVCVFTCMQRRI